jgi:hypothetical protein
VKAKLQKTWLESDAKGLLFRHEILLKTIYDPSAARQIGNASLIRKCRFFIRLLFKEARRADSAQVLFS